MSHSVFAPRSRLHLALGLAGLVAALLPSPLWAEPLQPAPIPSSPAAHHPPPATPPEQQQKLKERDLQMAEAKRLQQQNKLPEAIAAAERALALERQVLGDGHEEVAELLEWLACLHEQRDDLTAAKAARQEALTIRTRLHGEQHWRTADARRALADVERRATMTSSQRQRLAEADRLDLEVAAHIEAGRYREGMEPARRAVDIRRQILGEQHAVYANSLHNLARLYRETGEYARAEPLCQEVIEVRKRTLGEGHPAYAQGLDGLAAVYNRLADYARAEPLLRRAVAIQKQCLGERHPGYAEVLNDLAMLCQARGDYAQAVPLFQRALQIRRQALGEKHPDYAESLSSWAGLCRATGDYTRAASLYRQVLNIRKQALSEHHPSYAVALNGLALVYQAQGNYRQAQPLLVRAVEILKQSLGERHPDYAAGLGNLGGLCQSMADYRGAELRMVEALRIKKLALGEQHPSYAASLNNLALLYQSLGRYEKAEGLYKEAVQIARRRVGEGHPDYANMLGNLAWLYHARGQYSRAEPLYQEALKIKKQALGELHPDYVLSLNNLALLYHARGEYAKAQGLLRRAVDATAQQLGRRDPTYALCLTNLATLLMYTGEYARAEALYREVLRIYEGVQADHHPDYATILNNLASLYQELGEYAQAERLFGRALEIYRQALGEGHASYAQTLSNRALLYLSVGDHAKALPLLRQALEIRRLALGEKHPEYAQSLNNLARLYHSRNARGDINRAEPLYRQALQITAAALGEQHPDCAAILDNLASLYSSGGKYARALPLCQQALEIRRKGLGQHHPRYTLSLNNLALLYQDMGDYVRAESLLLQARQINAEALGEHHPDYATVLGNLAMLYWLRATELPRLVPQPQPLPNLAALYAVAVDQHRAERLQRQALEIARGNLELAAGAQSQRQQLVMLRNLRSGLDAYLSLPSEGQESLAEVYREVLTWKGAVGRRQRLQRLSRREARLAPDFAEFDRVSCRLATLALGAGDPKNTELRRRVQELTEQKEHLEGELAHKSEAFRREKQLQQLEPAQLQASLPADAVLLDFLEYNHFRPPLAHRGGLQGERRLAVFVVRRDGLTRIDLGPVRSLRLALQTWRQALQRRFQTEGDIALAEKVRRLVWLPLEPHLRGVRIVLVSPDGALACVPLAALPGRKKNTYLVEEVTLAIIPLPQLLPEVLRAGPTDRKAEPSLLLVGDVHYDAIPGSEVTAERRTIQPPGPGQTRIHWAPLESTGTEVGAIKDVFQRRFRKALVTDLREDEATEAEVRKAAPAHHYVHFATHGFFAPSQVCSALGDSSRGGQPAFGEWFNRGDVAGLHPGLLSGLVLAGANQPADTGKEDGILTALEVEALDLSGVELATLSACETGLGDPAGGEGLLGLQRAFQIAGARSVVASLWQVDDKATRELMVRFYENLWKRKLSKLEALRQAQLWMLREGANRGMVDVRVPKERLPIEDGRLAPYYWAAFSLSGDWR